MTIPESSHTAILGTRVDLTCVLYERTDIHAIVKLVFKDETITWCNFRNLPACAADRSFSTCCVFSINQVTLTWEGVYTCILFEEEESSPESFQLYVAGRL